MLSLAVNGYNATDVEAALRAVSGSRSVEYAYYLLDADNERIGPIDRTSGSITFSSEAAIKRTARFSVTRAIGADINAASDRIQPWFRLQMPDGGYAEWPLGIFLLSSPVRSELTSKDSEYQIDGYDVAQILEEDKFTARYVVPAGQSYTAAVRGILSSAGIDLINITDTDSTLSAAQEFEVGYPKLTAINDLLAAINYVSLHFDAYGYAVSYPYIPAYQRTPEFSYRTDTRSVVLPGASVSTDIFNVPNVFVRYVSTPDKSTLRSVYTNDDPASVLSTVSRGRNIVSVEEVRDIADQATLDAYTRRVAENAYQIYTTVEFNSLCMPHHTMLDCLMVSNKNVGLGGSTCIESAWSMELKPGGTMRHTVRKAVLL